MQLQEQTPIDVSSGGNQVIGRVQPTRAFSQKASRVNQGEEPTLPTPPASVFKELEAAGDALMETVTGGSRRYATMFAVIATGALHAVLAFATLSGVLLDASICADLQLPIEQVSLGNSLVFFGWIPGAIIGGPLGDRIGRKPAMVLTACVGALGMLTTGSVPSGAGEAFLATRLFTGIGIGGFVAPAFALLVESSDPRRQGGASVSWTWGYVSGVAVLCVLHYALFDIWHVGWRVEEFVLGAWVLAFAALTQLLVVESPRFLIASGRSADALSAARTLARWNSVDLDATLEQDSRLRPLRRVALTHSSLSSCEVAQEARKTGGAGAYAGAEEILAGEEATVVQGSSARPDGDAAYASISMPAEQQLDWTDLFAAKDGTLWLTLTFGAMEISYNLAFYVIIFSAGAISNQLLLNLVLLAAADLPGSTLSGLACDRVGAKTTALGFLAGGSVVLLLLATYTGWMQSSAEPLLPAAAVVTSALSLLGKSMCSGAFTAIYLLFSECYPTKLRSAALGSGMMFGKLGAAAASPLTTAVPLVTSLSISGGALLAAAAGAATLPGSTIASSSRPTDDG